ncbi:hypothetical protein HBHAL_2332 [Halobacillus halophilus DSM 2266]|uniref:Uncharacterized protein n=1 Tax=Halobacillus halophilus (strain ATCC 35676 / DSM 2266 / JCM 20832 / KCTC 3685 / LMG 17431 / NBRC 102448 / NCIMB 2269) TaxID=866895 RepID=I0JKL0_HALH3|nr:hypothetical protein HBHAL_2332 [Halobacillus halophilus DSM 2266]
MKGGPFLWRDYFALPELGRSQMKKKPRQLK